MRNVIYFIALLALIIGCNKPDKVEPEDPKYAGLENHPPSVKQMIKADEPYMEAVIRFELDGVTYYHYNLTYDGGCLLCNVYDATGTQIIPIDYTYYQNNATNHFLIWEDGQVVNQPL